MKGISSSLSRLVVSVAHSLGLEPWDKKETEIFGASCRGPCAYRRVAVRAGMLLRKVNRITMNMKKRSRVLFSQEEVHLPASASPGKVFFSIQLHSL